MAHVLDEEEQKRILAYKACASDREAAEILGLSMFTFREWRYARNLPARGKQGSKLKKAAMTLEELRAKLPR